MAFAVILATAGKVESYRLSFLSTFRLNSGSLHSRERRERMSQLAEREDRRKREREAE